MKFPRLILELDFPEAGEMVSLRHSLLTLANVQLTYPWNVKISLWPGEAILSNRSNVKIACNTREPLDRTAEIIPRILSTHPLIKVHVAPYLHTQLKDLEYIMDRRVLALHIDPPVNRDPLLLQAVGDLARQSKSEVFLHTWGSSAQEISKAISLLGASALTLVHRTGMFTELSLCSLQTMEARLGISAKVESDIPLSLLNLLGAFAIETVLARAQNIDAAIRFFQDVERRLDQTIRFMASPAEVPYDPHELDTIEDFRVGLVAARTLSAGTTLASQDLAIRIHPQGLSPMLGEQVTGRRLLYDLKEHEPITWGILQC